MKVTVDTNILVRAVVHDDAAQAKAADKLLRESEVVAVSATSLCEFVWVLRRVYGFGPGDVIEAIAALLDAANVVADRPAVDAGLSVLKAGGDFADGLIAHDGAWLGGETFISFDKQAVSMLLEQKQRAELLA